MGNDRTARSPAGTATAHEPRSPLLSAALELIGSSATPRELEARFEAVGATLAPGTAEALLSELVRLGVIRPSGHAGVEARHVRTSLGARFVAAGFDGRDAVALEELERLRTDLLSTISHELRTPLTAVRTSVGLLLDPTSDPTDDQRIALLSSIERNADRMQRLLRDILELSRLRAGNVGLQLRSFGSRALAEAAAAVVEPLASTHGQRIELDDRAGAAHAVYGDRRRLEQALINLLANAQRFSPDGATVRLRIERRGALTAWTVEDDGPGIPAIDQDRLFERFFVGRSDRSGPGEGVGLGLPTALAIAQAHEGTIEVRSVVGRGSSFTLVVPSAGPADEP